MPAIPANGVSGHSPRADKASGPPARRKPRGLIVVMQFVFALRAVLFGRLLGIALLRGTHGEIVRAV